MKIFLESVESGQDLPIANLNVLCHGELVGRILLRVDGAQSDVAAIGELLRDFADCLVEWTRRGAGLVAAEVDAYSEPTASKARALSSPAGAASAELQIRR